MSSLLFVLTRENPLGGIAIASLNLIVALSLVGVSVLLGVTISVLSWMHALAGRRLAALPQADRRRRFA
ncbi:hypothetical protein [Bradyrhizobium sp. STM 3557]|uniref:hypothetical protein n=1 Tax=Bradyrhizobium sp. STM 3557 TaxID=578920 RepID=UPI00388D3D62